MVMVRGELRIVFTGMPGPEMPRFVEIENENGESIQIGQWRERPDGLAELILLAEHALADAPKG